MADITFPVYMFRTYCKREYLYYASTSWKAVDFALAYQHAYGGNGAYLATERVPPEGVKPDHYRNWRLDFEYGRHTAVHENYDAEWLGEEDGWQDNGLRLDARTLAELIIEIDSHDVHGIKETDDIDDPDTHLAETE